jgi:hypothetical protein
MGALPGQGVDYMTIDYLFRLPKFPIICVIDDWLVTASSEVIFERRIANVALTPNTSYNIVDSTGEDWEFYSGQMYIVPMTRRKWSKKRIIQTYNQSRNCVQTGVTYSEKSLSSKRFEVVFGDIVALIEQSQK